MSYATKEDEMAALLCDLAAAICRRDHDAMRATIKALQLRGWDAPMDAAQVVVRVAVMEEQRARPKD